MEMKPTVCILMSTFNGEKYLRQQLDSIYAQEDVSLQLIVRDDGSTDNTVNILNEYKHIQIIKGSNIGCEESFKILLYSQFRADYYAFADQDDIWHSRKLISAIENINIYHCDLSVCNLMIADADMNIDRPMFSEKDIERLNYRFKYLVLGNLHGCTQVWTRRLHDIIQHYNPIVTYPHDVWVNAIANMVSSTYIDPVCYINYRLHGNNTGGLAKNIFQRVIKGFKRYILPKHPTNDILCKQLIEGYGKYLNTNDIRRQHLILVSDYKDNLFSKFDLLFSEIINRIDIQHRCLFWICILLNKF